jgi:Ca-activated chloride channel family protein
MKRLLWFSLVIATILSLVLSGCGGSTPATVTQPGTYKPNTPLYTPPMTITAVPATSYYTPPKTAIVTHAPSVTYAPGTGFPTQVLPPIYTLPVPVVSIPGQPAPNGNIGLAVGGAKDVGNFRENIQNDYLPLPSDITYEGLFYDYYFDTGASEPTNKLFAPSYSFAVTRDPLSGQTEYYLSVGLNSGMKESDFTRKKLNLVVVLDNSGSMGEDWDQYYYDGRNWVDSWSEDGPGSHRKIDCAKQALTGILNQLQEGDRISIVLFNSSASLVCGMTPVSRANVQQLVKTVAGITAGGSTNLDAGLDLATAQFKGLREVSSYEYENRIIILTDAMPNTGDYSGTGLLSTVQHNAQNRIYSTFIGVGVDFNSGLVEGLTKTRGANYYTVHSGRDFTRRVQDEFDFMVTPLVFDLQLSFEGKGWQIEKVFGSPEADQATGNLMYINTLFPSRSEGGQTRGGLVLLKLKKTSILADASVNLKVSYEDRNGKKDYTEARVALDKKPAEYFDNTGIRKGILLSRYAALLKNWTIDEKMHMQYSKAWDARINESTGIMIPSEAGLSQWERQSLPLDVSPAYKNIFSDFARYFEKEMNAIGDVSLYQEYKILDTLSRYR